MLLDSTQYFDRPSVVPPPDTGRIQRTIRVITQVYSTFLLVLFGLLPLAAIAYLSAFQSPALLFEEHPFHELVIWVATLEGLFVSYVTWRCYKHSGEPFLRWLTLGFLGFTLIYLPHGLFTGMAHEHMWLFLLYGPASRLFMGVCFFVGLLSYGAAVDPAGQRGRVAYWGGWLAVVGLIIVAVGVIALSPLGAHPAVRLSMEIASLVIALLGIVVVFARGIRSPLMTTFFTLSLAFFAQSSIAFVLGKPWNHMWWLAHVIFASGFFLLSYGVVSAYLTTRAFSTVLSQEELMAQLRMSNARTESALAELRATHEQLEHQAATDWLTGAANRRDFLARTDVEISRAARTGAPLSLLALDLDHFKHINDRYGHQAGDDLLKKFVSQMTTILRPSDIIGRFGGDEFVIALPDTTREVAANIGERCRIQLENNVKIVQDPRVKFGMCIGVAEFGLDGNTLEQCLSIADERLYRAKEAGRNQVVAM
ncbi:GGDEF domain-containing protein [Paraherbaspirillum soli]|uniref:diguanylate cyclase n=1 Tax=Paraherbaspirillum soli TaxID=631222 RepID=A0ABW0M9H9_9BURK